MKEKQPDTTDQKNAIVGDPQSSSSIPSFEFDDSGRIHIKPSDPKEVENLSKALGTTSTKTTMLLLQQLLGSIDRPMSADGIEGVISILQAANPNDELEAMLAIQMIATHILSMRIIRRCQSKNINDEQMNLKINQVSKLQRTFTTQLEALDKHRRGGKQQVVVKHVSVESGGQAIVGTVDQGGGGG